MHYFKIESHFVEMNWGRDYSVKDRKRDLEL